MSATAAGILQLLLLVALLALAHRPLGDYMARVFTGSKHLRVERAFYRIVRIDPDADQRWSTYLLSLLGFSMVSVLFLFGFQPWLFYLAATSSIVASLEELALLGVLREWRTDVRGLWWVLRERPPR